VPQAGTRRFVNLAVHSVFSIGLYLGWRNKQKRADLDLSPLLALLYQQTGAGTRFQRGRSRKINMAITADVCTLQKVRSAFLIVVSEVFLLLFQKPLPPTRFQEQSAFIVTLHTEVTFHG